VPVLLLLLVALGLRLYRLGQADLWGDEILYLRLCDPKTTVWQVIAAHIGSFSSVGHLPAVAALCNAFYRLVGVASVVNFSPVVARMPAIIMGMVSLVVLAAWIRRLVGRAVPFWLPFGIGAFSFAHWWYSREAYYYAGLFLFASLALYGCCRLLDDVVGTDSMVGRRRWAQVLWYGATASLGVVGLVFSHGSGMALAIPLGVYALVIGLRRAPRAGAPYWIAALVFACCLWIFMSAGTGQSKAAWIDAYRYSLWLVGTDLLEFYGLGPGLWRMAGTVGLMALGIWAVCRGRRPCAIGLLWLVPAVFLAVHLGGRNQMYHPRYFLLLLPFVLWLFTAALVWLVAGVPERRRGFLYALALVVLLANVGPGIGSAWRIHAKRDAHATLVRTMDSLLADGTICIWEGGHCMNFVPRFQQPTRPYFFGWLDAMPDDYLRGDVAKRLAAVTTAFPFVAYLEWGGMCAYPNQVKAGPERPPEKFQQEVAASFGGNVVAVGDRELGEALKFRWLPTAVPRFASHARERLDAARACAMMHLYYTRPVDVLRFRPYDREWFFTFAAGGAPMLLAGPHARIDVAVDKHVQASVRVVALVPGTLVLRIGGKVLSRPFARAGEVQDLSWPVEGPVAGQLWDLQFQPSGGGLPAGQPLFALLHARFNP
jgi:hypothetical protein